MDSPADLGNPDSSVTAALRLYGVYAEAARLAAARAAGRAARKVVVMGIGTGVVLIVIGAIFLFALNINIPYVSDNTLGIILIVAGAITLILALVMNAQRSHTSHVQENRYQGPPPA
jgi:uncharacterized membrane protein HdeD (DUF308 family)